MGISGAHAGTSSVDLVVTTYVEKYQRGTEKNASLSLIIYSTESGLFEVQERISVRY